MANTLQHALPVALALLGAAQVLASGQRQASLIAAMPGAAPCHLFQGDRTYRVTLVPRGDSLDETAACGDMPDLRIGDTLPDIAVLRDADASALRNQATTLLARFAARDAVATERYFVTALRMAPHDTCVLGAYADFLLDEGRGAEVPALLHEWEDVDALLLRQALALRWQGDAAALAPVRAQLQARFAAAARHGDNVHLREQARFTLHVLGNSRAALALAQRNWQVRKGWADARILLETAIAAQDSAALLPVLHWLGAHAPPSPVPTAS